LNYPRKSFDDTHQVDHAHLRSSPDYGGRSRYSFVCVKSLRTCVREAHHRTNAFHILRVLQLPYQLLMLMNIKFDFIFFKTSRCCELLLRHLLLSVCCGIKIVFKYINSEN